MSDDRPPAIRTTAEIAHAIKQLKDAASAPSAQKDPGFLKGCAGVIQALEWARGSDEPGGFGEMLRLLDLVDEEWERQSAASFSTRSPEGTTAKERTD